MMATLFLFYRWPQWSSFKIKIYSQVEEEKKKKINKLKNNVLEKLKSKENVVYILLLQLIDADVSQIINSFL